MTPPTLPSLAPAPTAESAAQAVDRTLAEASTALRTIFTRPGLPDQERIRQAKHLNFSLAMAEFKQGKSVVEAWPSLIELPVAGKCNLRCTMCSLSHGAPTYPNWSLAEVARFSPMLRFATYANPTGVGEPLTNKDFFEILKLFHRLGNEVGFYSNATLLTEERSRELIRLKVSQLNVSLDGATAATFENIRRYGKFATVTENLRTFTRLKREAGVDNPLLQIAMVLMKENVHEAPALVELAHELGAKAVFFMFVQTQDPTQFLWDEPARANRYLAEAKEAAKRLGLIISAPAPLPEVEKTPVETFVAEAKQGGHTRTGSCKCIYPWTHYMVHNDGQVGPCCRIRGEIDGFSFGSVQQSKPEELWNSPGMVHLRQRLSSDDAPEICRNCDIRTLKMG